MSDEEIRARLRAAKRRDLKKKRFIAVGISLIFTIISGFLIGRLVGNLIYKIDTSEPVSVAADNPLVNVGMKEVGNKGGEPFWSWYGFDYRVDWCACYTSWCEDQAGYLEEGVAPKFALVGDGASWFMDRDQWLAAGETPSPGDLIFFDWEQAGTYDHVGIVTDVIDDKVFTVEGNSSDRCRVKRYSLDDKVILGYGHIVK